MKGYERLVNDFYSENLTFDASTFRRRFRLRRELFLRIVNALENHSNEFNLRRDMQLKDMACHHSKSAQQLSINWQMDGSTILSCLANFFSI